MRNVFALTLACIAGSIAIPFAAAPRDISLKMSYRDAAAPSIPDGVRSDGLTSFTGSSYQYVHGVDDKSEVIIAGDTGNYRFSTHLDTRKPLRRRLCFDFGTQSSPFASPYCTDGLIGMHGDGRIQDMHYGEVLDQRVRHTWTLNGYEYYLGFGTDWDQSGTFDTLTVSVRCVAPETDPTAACASWTMTSNGVATLSRAKILSKGKLGTIELIGYYDMPFESAFVRQ